MTAYVKRNLGGKLFTIEWTLNVSGGVQDLGDFYENDGAELLSIMASSDGGITAFAKFSNVESDDLVMNVSGQVMVPVPSGFAPSYTPIPVIPPLMRRYGAQAVAGSSSNGTARIGMMFKEL